MKLLKISLIFLILGILLYFFWPNKHEAQKPKNIKVISQDKTKIPQKIETLDKSEKSKEIEIKNYINMLNKTIKAQYKEIEECEKEFDVHFRDLLEMAKEKQLEYIKDRNNLETLLDKFSSINFTTPSSAKVIKLFADPISGQVKITDIYHKPGLQDRVEICNVRGKWDILELLYQSKIKKKEIMRALIDFFENENATLDYPGILYNQVIELKKLLYINGISESKFPILGQIVKDYEAFEIKITKKMNEYSPRENATWDYEEAKLEHDFALKLQGEIKLLLKQIKEDLN